MKISPASIIAELRARYPKSANGIEDLPAALAALAQIESDLDPAAIGHDGETSLLQVLPATAAKYALPPTPSGAGAQLAWASPIVRALLLRAPLHTPIPRIWRHGHDGASPTPLDVYRELHFDALYSQYRNVATPAPGGAGAPLIFPAAPPSTLGVLVTTPAAVPASPIKQQIDKIRVIADQVRKTVDSIALVVTSIPFVGAVVGGYVRTIVLVVDSLDNAIDALDDSIP